MFQRLLLALSVFLFTFFSVCFLSFLSRFACFSFLRCSTKYLCEELVSTVASDEFPFLFLVSPMRTGSGLTSVTVLTTWQRKKGSEDDDDGVGRGDTFDLKLLVGAVGGGAKLSPNLSPVPQLLYRCLYHMLVPGELHVVTVEEFQQQVR